MRETEQIQGKKKGYEKKNVGGLAFPVGVVGGGETLFLEKGGAPTDGFVVHVTKKVEKF